MSQTPDITHLNDETLYELGKTIGQISAERPDITHHILLGVLSGMVNIESIHISGPRRPQYGWNISSTLEDLRWRWRWVLKKENASPPIPFELSRSPSGTGKV